MGAKTMNGELMLKLQAELSFNIWFKELKKIMKFKLNAPFYPTGDQPAAIKNLSDGVKNGEKISAYLV